MKDIFEEEETDGLLLVDASNAFNSLNREALLHNIKYICPPMSQYVKYVTAMENHLVFLSQEVKKYHLPKERPKAIHLLCLFIQFELCHFYL